MKFRIACLGALAVLSAPTLALAQTGCGGQPNSGYVCGNGQATGGLPGFYPQSTLLDRGFGSGAGTVLNRGVSGWVATVAPALGVNGGTGGSLVLNGATSGSATLSVPAAAGSVLFQIPATNGTNNQVLSTDGSGHLTWQTLTGTGTVTSVGLAMPGIFTVSGSPITTNGTLTATLATETANTVWAGPTTGAASAPTFRALVGADLPAPGLSSLGGVQANAAVTSQWMRNISTSGVPQLSQPSFSDISGSLAPTQCPASALATLGCVNAINATASQWLRALSTSGVFTASQPNFSDLAGNASLAQLPGIGNNTVLANNSGGTATPLALTASNVLDMVGTTQGSVLYRGASNWTALTPGSSGQVLQSNGAAANPSWATISGTGTVTSISAGSGITLSPSPITTTGSVALSPINNGTVLANVSGISAAPTGTTPSAVLDVVGSTQGSVLYRGASNWSALTPGTSGQFLQTQGAGSTPQWASAVTSSGTSTSGHIASFSGTSGSVIQDQAAISTAQDMLFASGRPWCDVRAKGAVGNGSTDDSTAFNACITQCLTTSNFGACIVYVPPSSSAYCIKSTVNINTGLTTNGGIILKGGGVQGTVLSACGANINLINLNNQWAQVREMTVQGYGFGADPVFSGTAPSQPTILLQSGCSSCVIENVYAIGGTAAIQNNGACGYTLSNVWGSFSYGDGVHVAGFFYQISCGGTIWNSHFDMVYPVSQPAHGATIAAWTNAHAYTAGTIVTVTCNSRSFWIQAVNSGTSSGAFPGCKPFGQNITDNTQTWTLVNAATSYCIQLDTGAIETEISQTDATCAANYNIGFTNTFAGAAPTQNSIIRSTPGGGVSGNLYINAGNHFSSSLLETSYCMLTGCAGVYIDSASVGTSEFIGLDCLNSFSYCMLIGAAATNVTINTMHASGADTADLAVAAAATGFKFTNSTHVSGSGSVFTVSAVAADHYIIANNICNGASSSDGGTGTHKSVTACTAGGP